MALHGEIEIGTHLICQIQFGIDGYIVLCRGLSKCTRKVQILYCLTKGVRLNDFVSIPHRSPCLNGCFHSCSTMLFGKNQTLADKVILGYWKLLGGSNGNLLEDTWTDCCHGRTKGSEIIKSRNKMQP